MAKETKSTTTKKSTNKYTAKKKTSVKKTTTAIKADVNNDSVKKAKVIDMKSKKEMEVSIMKNEAINALENAGFKRWRKGGYDRLYISAAKLGLKIDEYGTTFMGDPIDDKEGQRMKAAKTYVDVHTGEVFSGNDMLEEAAGSLISKILTIDGAGLAI